MSPKEKKTIKTRIDVTVPGYGRFLKRSGATSIAEHRARKALLYRLIEAGQLDVIGMLDRDEVTWMELRQAERKKILHSDTLAASVAMSRRLWDTTDEAKDGAFSKTLPRMGRTESSRNRYATAFGQIKEHAADFLPGNAIVKDLLTADWSVVWANMVELSPASRNRVRSALSAFLTQFLGDKHHPDRRTLMKALGGMEDERTQPKEVTLEEFWTNVAKLDEAITPIALTLAATGMRIGELLACTEQSIRHLPTIWVEGKTGGDEVQVAESLVPFVEQAIPCRIAPVPKTARGIQYDARYKKVYKAFKKASLATGVAWSPHYLRHLYAQLGTAELPAVLVQHGLRHKTAAMTNHYAKRRTAQQVADVVGKALTGGVRGKVRGEPQENAS